MVSKKYLIIYIGIQNGNELDTIIIRIMENKRKKWNDYPKLLAVHK